MDETTKQAVIMREIREAILDAIGACTEKHRATGGIRDASYLGAVSWVLADFMIAADIQPDDAFLSRLNQTVEVVRMKNALEWQESIH